MAKALGLGGVFLRAQDPDALKAWYQTHLGVDMTPGYWMQEAGPTVMQPFAQDNDYFALDRPLMLNFRVDDLAALISQLEAAGISVETRPEWNSEIGSFARVHDPEGNPVELWEMGPATKG